MLVGLGPGQGAIVVHRVGDDRGVQLLQVVAALLLAGAVEGVAQLRGRDAHQDRHDGEDDQEFDEGEGVLLLHCRGRDACGRIRARCGRGRLGVLRAM